MITFILNDKTIHTEEPEGTVLLDFIRYNQHLMGTKAGCREGDCGACTVLEGHLEDKEVRYKSIASCLTPLGNVHGKHIVTIEGLQKEKLSPVQQAIVDNAATQCGFCTPGFVMSLTAHSLAPEKSTPERVIQSISGNICRCTGYQSIKGAAEEISRILSERKEDNPLEWLIQKAFLPEYFRNIAFRLQKIQASDIKKEKGIPVAGGTDLYVQQAETLAKSNIRFLKREENLRHIEIKDGYCSVGGAVTVSDIMHNQTLRKYFPNIQNDLRLVSSEPIRNMGTVAGNIVNASPIADLVIFLLALDAHIFLLSKEGNKREVALQKFYTGYKQMKLNAGEIITSIRFQLPDNAFFHFEKVSKRKYLDIASVNSALFLSVEKNKIKTIRLSAGGVYPWPYFAEKTVTFLTGKILSLENIIKASEILLSETAPISDIRGSKNYKSLLLRQLFFAHFIELFPQQFSPQILLPEIVTL